MTKQEDEEALEPQNSQKKGTYTKTRTKTKDKYNYLSRKNLKLLRHITTEQRNL